MIEEKALGADLGIADPVSELRAVSHDPSLTHRMRLRDGRRLTALDLQWAYFERARSFVDDRYGTDADEQTVDVLDRWESVLDRLGRDPMLCADELDWVAKLRLLEGYREREKLGWGSHKLQLVDLQYSDVRPEKGLYHRLVAARLDEDAARPTSETAHGDDRAAGGHPGLLPRPLPGPVRLRGGRRQLGLGHLRRGPGVAGAGADDGAGARHQHARGRALRPLRERQGPAGDAHRRLTAGRRVPVRRAEKRRAAGFSSPPRGKFDRRAIVEEAAMATRDSGGQSQSGKSRQGEEIEDVTTEANPEVAERHAEITEDVDDLLDEIDSVLEENAEEFVRGYVQKGGQWQ